jgi:hypothetical protein
MTYRMTQKSEKTPNKESTESLRACVKIEVRPVDMHVPPSPDVPFLTSLRHFLVSFLPASGEAIGDTNMGTSSATASLFIGVSSAIGWTRVDFTHIRNRTQQASTPTHCHQTICNRKTRATHMGRTQSGLHVVERHVQLATDTYPLAPPFSFVDRNSSTDVRFTFMNHVSPVHRIAGNKKGYVG